MVIAIDFDNTIFVEEYPFVGDLIDGAKETINKYYNLGHTIIIWTCRHGDTADAAMEALSLHGIKYHYFNENDPERIAKYGNDSRKIGCDVLIDDRDPYNKLHGVDWQKIDNMLQKIAHNG